MAKEADVLIPLACRTPLVWVERWREGEGEELVESVESCSRRKGGFRGHRS
jgi:hypothetical protein